MNVLDVDIRIGHSNSNNGGRRSLLSTLYLAGPSTLLPWAQHHLVDVMDKPDVKAETALFWRELSILRLQNIFPSFMPPLF